MFGGNDLKMALRYYVKRTELANSNIGLLIKKNYAIAYCKLPSIYFTRGCITKSSNDQKVNDMCVHYMPDNFVGVQPIILGNSVF